MTNTTTNPPRVSRGRIERTLLDNRMTVRELAQMIGTTNRSVQLTVCTAIRNMRHRWLGREMGPNGEFVYFLTGGAK